MTATCPPSAETWLAWRASLPPIPAGCFSRAGKKAALADIQGGLCAACLTAGMALEMDHDHRTGYVRGLLCRSCNVQAGKQESQLFGVDRPDIVLYLANPPAFGARWLWATPEPELVTIDQAIATLVAIELPPLE